LQVLYDAVPDRNEPCRRSDEQWMAEGGAEVVQYDCKAPAESDRLKDPDLVYGVFPTAATAHGYYREYSAGERCGGTAAARLRSASSPESARCLFDRPDERVEIAWESSTVVGILGFDDATSPDAAVAAWVEGFAPR
jgi:hypothetical protein